MRVLVAAVIFMFAFAVQAQEVTISASDTVQSVLTAQKGKRVTVRLRSGQEFSGTVRDCNGKVAVIGAVTGREFFDFVVALEHVEAVMIRIK